MPRDDWRCDEEEKVETGGKRGSFFSRGTKEPDVGLSSHPTCRCCWAGILALNSMSSGRLQGPSTLGTKGPLSLTNNLRVYGTLYSVSGVPN